MISCNVARILGPLIATRHCGVCDLCADLRRRARASRAYGRLVNPRAEGRRGYYAARFGVVTPPMGAPD
jgi:hypothetical protein